MIVPVYCTCVLFCKKGVLNSKTPVPESVFNNFIKKEPQQQMYSSEFCEISRNTFSYRIPRVAVSVKTEKLKVKLIAII